MEPRRVVSVLPSATEIMYALGHGSELVGRSAECDFPAETYGLPVVMRPRTLYGDRPSREIDRRVREVRGSGRSLYTLDVGLLRRLRPDVLLTQDLCGVCSVTDEEVAEACAQAGVRPEIVSLSPTRLSEVWSTFERVSRAIGDPAAGRRLGAAVRAKLPPAPGTSTRPSVAVVEWLDPPILSGLWTPDIIAAGGGSPLGPRPGAVAERTTWERIADQPPELLVLSPCSFPVERTRRELRDPEILRRLSQVAPPKGVILADEAYFSRPGPRLAEGVRLIHALLRGDTSSLPMPAERWTDPRGGRAA